MALAADQPLITVRNTFIEMRGTDQVYPMRRCLSAPNVLILQDIDVEGEGGGQSSPSKLSDDSSTFAGTEASGDEASTSCPSIDSPTHREALHRLLFLPVAITSEVHRSPLSSKAQAWKPMAKKAGVSPHQATTAFGTFRLSAMFVLQEVAAMARQFSFCSAAEVCWHGGPSSSSGCTLQAMISSEHMLSSERLATAAKEAIFASTAQACGVHLLGGKRTPFTPTPQGFVAVLGSVPDTGRKCKNLYDCGFCKYGRQCRHQHPSSTISLNFVIVAAGPACDVLTTHPQQQLEQQQDQQQQLHQPQLQQQQLLQHQSKQQQQRALRPIQRRAGLEQL